MKSKEVAKTEEVKKVTANLHLSNVTPNTTVSLMHGSLLARNTVLNLIGHGAPFLVAIFVIPLLIRGLGTARFGVLTLAWMVVGYFSLFDLGLGRALTKLLAEKLGAGQDHEIPELIWTALTLMGMLGLIGALVAAGLSPWLVHGALKIPAALRDETLKAFYLLALFIPIVISTTGLRGILEAHQRFGQVNAVRMTMGVFIFLGPLAVLPFSNSLYPVIGMLVVVRFIAWAAHLVLCLRLVPVLRNGVTVKRGMIRPLVSFGGWMTVSNVVGPIISYLDRFLIGALLTMAAVAYYATPYEVITKLWIIPIAMVGVLFPAFSYGLAQDREKVERLFYRSMKYVFIAMFPICFLFSTFSTEVLYFWIGKEFAENSGPILQIMALGVFINSGAQIPSALIQALGRPDIKAKIHLVELPIFIAILYLFVNQFGALGAAIAFLLRIIADFFAFLIMTGLLYPAVLRHIRWAIGVISCSAVVMYIPILYEFKLKQNLLFCASIIISFGWIVWTRLLDKSERNLVFLVIKSTLSH